MVNIKDLTGKRFGNLVVLSRLPENTNSGGTRWRCKCDCGKEVEVAALNLSHGDTKSCGCIKGISRRKGSSNITGTYWKGVKNNAKIRSLEFTITIDYAQKLLEEQKFKCALSNIPLIMDVNNTFKRKGKYGINTGSLDRIDSSKGYIEGNVQWVHKKINNMKQDLVDEDFIKWCDKISKFRGNYPKYTPTLSELIDRVTILQLKEIFISENRESYAKEIKDALFDINTIITENNIKFTAEDIRNIIILSQFNLHIWHNESEYRKNGSGGNLELTHNLNGIRNISKNLIQEKIGGRVDLKIDCLAADAKHWRPSW